MREEIRNWLDSSQDPYSGINLLEKFCPDKIFIRLMKINPNKNRSRIVKKLAEIANLDFSEIKPSAKRSAKKGKSFREEFPFLSSPVCPIELKALVTDKFSSFYAYRDLHEKLFDCTTAEECADTAAKLLDNYHENRMIYAELTYFKKHNSLLGKHPVFSHYRKLKEIQSLSIKELVIKQRQLQHNIWRIESEIKKGDKPHLLEERTRRLEGKKIELAEVDRLLN
ncbi:MAG: hypothetical protein PHQ67_01485 [Fermentimonas sp.]|jgi:hypothetical protein|nr:hypothetical protein [Fermentimonas sp.]MDD4008464.1 hypothetical protein [Fermentimonas sp.]MDD4696915.1 hypothetical protein [Fermentimonas sp.]